MRIFFTVLDSFGVGNADDACLYGDEGSDTCGHIADAVSGFTLPSLESIGLGVIRPHHKMKPQPLLNAHTAVLKEVSKSKDTTAGHWELMGVPVTNPFPNFMNGFPKELLDAFEKETGYGWIGNIAASGTEIIEKMGDEHLRTGKVIIYTSADSVFQIAAHVDVVSLDKLYEMCEISRKLVDYYKISRVIARPFSGPAGNFFRLNNKRHDYAMKPPAKTYLDVMREHGVKTVSVGKIYDIFSKTGIDDAIHTEGNRDGMKKLLELQKSAVDNAFIFTNLVEFDSVYGHRRNVEGYYNALVEFDTFLAGFIKGMKQDDFLFITADHGCDPTYEGTDHTRENVPLIIYSPSLKKAQHHGNVQGFMKAGATALSLFGLSVEEKPLILK